MSSARLPLLALALALIACREASPEAALDPAPAPEHPSQDTSSAPLVDEPPTWERLGRALLRGERPEDVRLAPQATRYRECLSCWIEPIERFPLTLLDELPAPPPSYATRCDAAARCCHLEGLEASTTRREVALHAVCFSNDDALVHAATFTPRRLDPPRISGRRFFARPGAFYVARDEGVVELRFPDLQRRVITRAPRIDPDRCPSAREGVRFREYITGVTDDRLTLIRLSGCGYEGRTVRTEHVVELDTLQDRRARGIQAIARSGDDIFIGDAGRCEDPLAWHTPGALFLSTDSGASFEILPIIADAGPADTPVAEILTLPGEPGHLVVRTAHCPGSPANFGAQLYRTRDAGESFERVELPEAIDAGLHPLERVWRVGPSLDDLAIFDGRVSWRQVGEAWEPAPELQPPPPTRRVRAPDGAVLRVSDDGLLRYRPDLLGGFSRVLPP